MDRCNHPLSVSIHCHFILYQQYGSSHLLPAKIPQALSTPGNGANVQTSRNRAPTPTPGLKQPALYHQASNISSTMQEQVVSPFAREFNRPDKSLKDRTLARSDVLSAPLESSQADNRGAASTLGTVRRGRNALSNLLRPYSTPANNTHVKIQEAVNVSSPLRIRLAQRVQTPTFRT